MKIMKAELDSAIKTYQTKIKKDEKIKNMTIPIKDNAGKTHKLKITQFYGILQQKNIFQHNNNRKPNYVTNTGLKCSTLPICIDYQDNAYNCCPTSLSMAIACLGGFKPENVCAKTINTQYGSGTNPADLVNNAAKLGYKVTPIKRNYKAVLNSLQHGRPVIAHIQTKNASCLGYQGDYGHYVLIYWCKKGNYYIADPTKGIKKCKDSILDKATNGRNIQYYSVMPV